MIGEALALRNAWVVDGIVKATERAQHIASKLGKDWDVVFAQMPVTASTRGGGMGEIYDASVWIVTKGKREPLKAAPRLVLQERHGAGGLCAAGGRDGGAAVTAGAVSLPSPSDFAASM